MYSTLQQQDNMAGDTVYCIYVHIQYVDVIARQYGGRHGTLVHGATHITEIHIYYRNIEICIHIYVYVCVCMCMSLYTCLQEFAYI